VSRETLFRKEANQERIAQQHLDIFKAIQRRDAEGAAREARRHIDFVAEELRRLIEREKK
jgi:DNA-binding FadR family transcriptional regulator